MIPLWLLVLAIALSGAVGFLWGHHVGGKEIMDAFNEAERDLRFACKDKGET